MPPIDSDVSKKILSSFPSYFTLLSIGVGVLLVDTVLTKASAIISSLLFSKKNNFINDQLSNDSSCCTTIIPFSTKHDLPTEAITQEESPNKQVFNKLKL
ncbi:hypothetical protein EBR43_00675 [bacterium]|nr:hypothetical protein [bacterium]NBX72468.1 hypothetical protein [bacterium]